ncbi:restriction endonuclease subunit S [Gordonia cholesterolivorans]|uniref:Type I restriction modification DNA specificity domain-containing protein n=1 Tax=Gordonia cholesterolivorans TaxID=559625 RepID=A0ABN3I2L6_9ACTN
MSSTVRLREVGSTYGGLTGKTKADFGRGDARFVTFLEVINSTRLSGRALEQVQVKKGERQNSVKRGDVLFNGSSETPEEVALSAVVDFDPNISTFLNSFCFGFRLRPDAAVDSTYLAYFFRSTAGRSLVSSLAQGATRYNIAKTKFLDVELALPSIERQREIVEWLKDADDLIATLERLIAKKHAIKQGMMQQLLTGRTRLPGFTGEWADIRLGDHVSYVKTVALSRAQLDTKSPLKYLHYGDIHTRSSVILDGASEEMPRASAKLAARAGLLQCGDLVFADASEDPAGVGKSVEIVSTPNTGVVPGLHTIAARFDKSVLADGFKAYLQFIPSFRDQLLRLAAGTKVLATTRSYISSITLILPGVAEQKAIAEALHDSEREIEALRVRLSKAQSMKTGMMQQLLTGRTRLPVEAAL